MIRKKLSDVVNILDDSTSGIFYALQTLGLTDIDLSNYEYIDRLYYLSHSGDKYISGYYNKMIDANKTISDIAKDLKAMFYNRWLKIYKSLTAEYDPIENYDMTEHEEVNSKLKNTASSKRYGFNTESDAVGDLDTENESSGSKDDNYRDLHRHGNIGVTKPSDMVLSELEVRKNKFYDIMMKDIDTMLCLKIY